MRDVASCILSWGSRKTLIKTLESYRIHDLLGYTNQNLIYFQAIEEEDIRIAKEYKLLYYGGWDNVGIDYAMKFLSERATSPLILFLENDWELIEGKAEIKKQLDYVVNELLFERLDFVKLRSRKNPGSPLYSGWLKGREETDPRFLLDSVYWYADPTLRFPDKIDKISDNPLVYKSDSKYSNYSHNPCMFRRSWFLQNIGPKCVLGLKSLEQSTIDWWGRQSFKVAHSNGLFTHSRIG